MVDEDLEAAATVHPPVATARPHQSSLTHHYASHSKKLLMLSG